MTSPAYENALRIIEINDRLTAETHALIDRLQEILPTLLDRRAVAVPAPDVVGDYVVESEGKL